ncbi:MAG: hypothetical protein QF358_11440, partial [Arenicellales bacterium]|nr:hypothetical protein [Arenicellales bacterium]
VQGDGDGQSDHHVRGATRARAHIQSRGLHRRPDDGTETAVENPGLKENVAMAMALGWGCRSPHELLNCMAGAYR